MGVEDTPYNRWVSAAMIVGVIQKIYEPASLVRVFPTLVGPHSAGKSTTVHEILEFDHRDLFFTSSLNFAQSNEEIIYLLDGKVLAEFPETVGLKRKEAGAVKAFTTERVREARPKYQAVSRSYVAGTFFIATANGSQDFLPNDSALVSRFPILYVDRYRDTTPVDWFRENRLKLFASAKRLYLDGMRLDDIPPEFRAEIEERASGHRFMNETIRDALCRIKAGSGDLRDTVEGGEYPLKPGERGLTCLELADRLDMKADANNLRSALKNDPAFEGRRTRRGMAYTFTEEAWKAVPKKSPAKRGNRLKNHAED